MTLENLQNKIGFQIGFLLHSGKSVEATIENLKNIAIDYAESKEIKNEWIKINGITELKGKTNVFVFTDKGNIFTYHNYIAFDSVCEFQKITHYKEIIKPKSPVI